VVVFVVGFPIIPPVPVVWVFPVLFWVVLKTILNCPEIEAAVLFFVVSIIGGYKEIIVCKKWSLVFIC
jgi:hypothetical protein